MTDTTPTAETPNPFIRQQINLNLNHDLTAAERRRSIELIAQEIAAAAGAAPSDDHDPVQGQILLKTDVLTRELLELHAHARHVGEQLAKVDEFAYKHCPISDADDKGRENWRKFIGLERCAALATFAGWEILHPNGLGEEPDITHELEEYGDLIDPTAGDIDHEARNRTTADRSPAIDTIAAELATRATRTITVNGEVCDRDTIATMEPDERFLAVYGELCQIVPDESTWLLDVLDTARAEAATDVAREVRTMLAMFHAMVGAILVIAPEESQELCGLLKLLHMVTDPAGDAAPLAVRELATADD